MDAAKQGGKVIDVDQLSLRLLADLNRQGVTMVPPQSLVVPLSTSTYFVGSAFTTLRLWQTQNDWKGETIGVVQECLNTRRLETRLLSPEKQKSTFFTQLGLLKRGQVPADDVLGLARLATQCLQSMQIEVEVGIPQEGASAFHDLLDPLRANNFKCSFSNRKSSHQYGFGMEGLVIHLADMQTGRNIGMIGIVHREDGHYFGSELALGLESLHANLHLRQVPVQESKVKNATHSNGIEEDILVIAKLMAAGIRLGASDHRGRILRQYFEIAGEKSRTLPQGSLEEIVSRVSTKMGILGGRILSGIIVIRDWQTKGQDISTVKLTPWRPYLSRAVNDGRK